MANTPTAVLKVTQELTLPNNEIILNGSESFHTDKSGIIRQWFFKQTEGPECEIIVEATKHTAKAIVPTDTTVDTKYTFELVVRKGGLDSPAVSGSSIVHPEVIPIPVGKTIFGIQPQGYDWRATIDIANALGVKAIRTSHTIVGDDGSVPTAIKEFKAAGFDILTNFSNDRGSKFVSAAQFPSYRAAFDKILKTWKQYIKIAVMENEWTNKNYYQDSIENAIAQYRVFVEVCNANGVLCSDGGTHVPYLKVLATGGRVDGNILDVKKIIEALATIPASFANMHFNNNGKVPFDPNDIKIAADHLRKITGIEVISNEHHTENAIKGAIEAMEKGCADAGLIYALFFSGKQPDAESKADRLTDEGSTKLNALGIEYRDAIAALQ